MVIYGSKMLQREQETSIPNPQLQVAFSEGEALKPALGGTKKMVGWAGMGLARCKQTKEFCREENLPDNFDRLSHRQLG